MLAIHLGVFSVASGSLVYGMFTPRKTWVHSARVHSVGRYSRKTSLLRESSMVREARAHFNGVAFGSW